MRTQRPAPQSDYLSVSRGRIRQHAELEYIDFVALHEVAALRQDDPLPDGIVDVTSRVKAIVPAPRPEVAVAGVAT